MSVSNGEILKVTYETEMVATDTIFQNVYYLKFHTIGTRSDAAVLADLESWIEDAHGEIDEFVKSTMQQNLCAVDVIAWDTDEWVVDRNIGYIDPTLTFADTGEMLPQQSAWFALFKTARPKSNGKKYLAGMCEASSGGGYLTSPALTGLAAYAAEILNGISIDLDTYYTAGVPRTGVNTWLDFTLAVVGSLIRTQRRRVPGVGE
jgi:hypothetical protein